MILDDVIFRIAWARANRRKHSSLIRMWEDMDQEYHKLWYNYTKMVSEYKNRRRSSR